MELASAALTGDFPPQLDQTELDIRCARESFTWGPAGFWMLAGLIWLFQFVVRDVPDVARAVLPFSLGATVLAALAAVYEVRRRKRRIALFPLGGRIGCYRGHQFQYSFTHGEMLRERVDFFTRMMVVFKQLVPMVLLMVIVAVVMYDGLKKGGPQPWQDIALFGWAMLFAVFGFVAMYRSNFRLIFFWIPNGKGKTNRPLRLHPRELLKLDEGERAAIR
jgi:hypothetical protein